MVLAGDSAGGNLVFALALYLRELGIEMPAGLCGISPVGTLDESLPSRKERVDRDCIIGADFTEEMQITYIRDYDVKNPYLSPIYGDFTGLPPIWMCVGTEEVFYDDAFAPPRCGPKQGDPGGAADWKGPVPCISHVPGQAKHQGDQKYAKLY